MNNNANILWVYVVIALLVGLGMGYWYGTMAGKEQGRTALLAEQKAAAEEAKKQAQEEIVEAANPFETENPLQSGYENPFNQQVNPFAE